MCERDLPEVTPVKKYVPTTKALEEFVKTYRDNRLRFKEEFPEFYKWLFPNR
jgi:hypothetical protein